MKQLIIFDLDGTLLNTIDDIGHATNHALSQCGYAPHPIAAYHAMVGNGVKRLLQRALPSGQDNDDEVERLRRYFIDYYEVHCQNHSTPYPGISELLTNLSERGIKLAVASNKYQAAVEKLVASYFPSIPWVAVEGQKEGVKPKPDPSILFEILLKCQTPKADVLFVGDSGVDIDTARRACIESVGVSWGFRPIAELKAHYADHIVSDPDSILDIALRQH